MVDLFHPDLIAAQKQYAKDLLTHVNAYTKAPYTSEPAVCMVEINNEDTLFLWGGEQKLANLPPPYAGMLQKLWNDWLLQKYQTQENLGAAWKVGAEPLGPNQVRDPGLASLNQNGTPYTIEQHDTAKMTLTRIPSPHIPLAKIDITSVDGTAWHLQFSQGSLKLKKGQFYTLSFRCRTDGPKQITATVSQAHQPWLNLGLSASVKLYKEDTDQYYGFVATADDDNARICFLVGQETGTLYLGNFTLRTGGQTGLDKLNEDPATATVRSYQPGASWTANRKADWYDFLQQLDEKYFVDFKNYLHNDLKVQAPVTGSIGLGPLGTLSQSKMDFVDAHAYWDHPQFPNHDWSARNWLINNKPMVDNPAGATLWQLAATRVAGKPFTVTEYNHSAPNEYQAEAIPMIATYAALQDWDAVYLFAYGHNAQFEKDKMNSYFDIEGNWLKMAAMPLASRIFLSDATRDLASSQVFNAYRQKLLANASQSYYEIAKAWKPEFPNFPGGMLSSKLSLAFHDDESSVSLALMRRIENEIRIAWNTAGAGGGRFIINDPHVGAFVGFTSNALPAQIGSMRLEASSTPFVSLMLASADPYQPLAGADRLLLVALARAQNTNQQWNETRTSLSTNWGKAPPQIEVVKATLRLPHDYTVRPLDSAGKPLKEFQTNNQTLTIGDTPTLWYELIRRP
jgi:hypothetical protein